MISGRQEVEALKDCNSRWMGSGLAAAHVHGPITQPRDGDLEQEECSPRRGRTCVTKGDDEKHMSRFTHIYL